MTVSKERRVGDQATALRHMMSEVGDHSLTHVYWAIADEPTFSDLLSSTWAELEEQGLIEPRHVQGSERYGLTPYGWLVALRLTGAFEDEDFRGRCVALVKYFKGRIDGRRAFGTPHISHHQVQADGFAFGWVLNVLRADVLQEMFPDKKMNAYWDDASTVVRVPVTFGMPE